MLGGDAKILQPNDPPEPAKHTMTASKLVCTVRQEVPTAYLQKLPVCCVPHPHQCALVTGSCKPLAIQAQRQTHQRSVVGADELGLLAVIQLYADLQQIQFLLTRVDNGWLHWYDS